MGKKTEKLSIHDYLDWRSEVEYAGLITEEPMFLRTEVELRGLLREIGTPSDFTQDALDTMRKEVGGTLKLWGMANKAGISDRELELIVVCFLALRWEELPDPDMKELLEAIDAGVMAERESLRMLRTHKRG